MAQATRRRFYPVAGVSTLKMESGKSWIGFYDMDNPSLYHKSAQSGHSSISNSAGNCLLFRFSPVLGNGLDPAADMQFFADFFNKTAHGFAGNI